MSQLMKMKFKICKQENSKIMGLKKGMTNNPAGRLPGALNKVAKDLRLTIVDFLETNWNEVIELWSNLEPKDKIKFYETLMQYAVPKMQSVAVDLDLNLENLTEKQLDYIIETLINKENGS